jgi:hypothetical protein
MLQMIGGLLFFVLGAVGLIVLNISYIEGLEGYFHVFVGSLFIGIITMASIPYNIPTIKQKEKTNVDKTQNEDSAPEEINKMKPHRPKESRIKLGKNIPKDTKGLIIDK